MCVCMSGAWVEAGMGLDYEYSVLVYVYNSNRTARPVGKNNKIPLANHISSVRFTVSSFRKLKNILISQVLMFFEGGNVLSYSLAKHYKRYNTVVGSEYCCTFLETDAGGASQKQ